MNEEVQSISKARAINIKNWIQLIVALIFAFYMWSITLEETWEDNKQYNILRGFSLSFLVGTVFGGAVDMIAYHDIPIKID